MARPRKNTESTAQPMQVGSINFEVPVSQHRINQIADDVEKKFGTVTINTPLQYTPITVPKPRKICIVGTAPQWSTAPFDDPSWEIWGIFGVACAGKRLTRLYEVHDRAIIEEQAKQTNGKYWEVANALGENYITKDHFDQCPKAKRFDFASKRAKYGDYFASSAAWLIADAIDEGATELAIYGVNMASDSEYAYQKPSCTFMIGWAKAMGIKVFIPPSSELLSIPFQYGIEARPRALCALDQKKAEINQQLTVNQQNLETSKMGINQAQANLQLLQWVEQNWK